MGGHGSQPQRGMEAHGHRPRPWMLLVPVGVIGLVAHSAVLYAVLSHVALSAAAVAGAIILIVIKHLGLLSPLYALFRRRFRR